MIDLGRAGSLLVLIVLSSAAAAAPLRIGVVAGPDEDVMAVTGQVAARSGLDLRLKTYTDDVALKQALTDGEVDAAGLESLTDLAPASEGGAAPLHAVGLTLTLPMAFYSAHLRHLNQLPAGATIALPDDPQDCARALVLLQNYGLITFPDSAGLHATPADIDGNPRELRFVRFDAAHLNRLPDDVAVVALPWQIARGLDLRPPRDAIGMEDARSPWVGALAVREADRDQPWVAGLLAAAHSSEVKHFILVYFHDAVRRPW